MLKVTDKIGFGVPGLLKPTSEYIGTFYSANNLAVHSYTVDIGNAVAGQKIAVSAMAQRETTITSIAIDGVNGDLHAQASSPFDANIETVTGIASRQIGDDVNGNIAVAVTYAISAPMARIGVHRLLNTEPTVPVAQKQAVGALGNSQQVILEAPPYFVLVAACFAGTAQGTWSGAIWRVAGLEVPAAFLAQPNVVYVQTGMQHVQDAPDATLSVQCEATGSGTQPSASLAAVAWGPS